LIVAGLALLAGGAHALLLGAVSAARALGVSEAVIGLTVVSVGSALPELITTMVGAWRGQGDLVLGNAVGSCICKVFGVLGLTALITPLRDPALLPAHFLAFLAAAALVAPLLWTGHTLARREGVALLGAYALYLFTMRPG
jgi:cation:H+ antiporter